MAKGLVEVENHRGGSWLSWTFHGWGIQEAPVSHPNLVLCPFRHGERCGCTPTVSSLADVQTWGSSGCFHQSPFICGLLPVFDTFSLLCNERLFSDIPLGAVSFLAVVNSAVVQTSAYSISIEQLHVCRLLNLELWSEWWGRGNHQRNISYFWFCNWIVVVLFY